MQLMLYRNFFNMFNEMECDGSVMEFYEDSSFRDYIL